MTEQELARVVVTELQRLGYKTYEEVSAGYSGPRADIVAIMGAVTMVVETKVTLSLALLDQLSQWEGRANRIVGAIPHLRRHSGSAVAYCRLKGFGLWNVGVDEFREMVRPRLFRLSAAYARTSVRRMCDEAHASGLYASAGTRGGGYFTPFRATCRDLLALVEKEPGITLRAAIKRVDHHYASFASAISSLPGLIRRGVVDGIQLVDERPLKLVPSPETNEVAS